MNNAADAEAVVRFCKFPPLGRRSVAALGPTMRYQPPPLAESIEQQNAATMVCVLLETQQQTLARARSRLPGVDVLMIGSVDLSTEVASRAVHRPGDAAGRCRLAAACQGDAERNSPWPVDQSISSARSYALGRAC